MSVQSTLMIRRKDGKRIGFLKTDGKLLIKRPVEATEMLYPLHWCTLPAMIETLQQWNLCKHIKSKEDYNHYKLLKDVLHNPRGRGLGRHEKVRCGHYWKAPWLSSPIFRLLSKPDRTPGTFSSWWNSKRYWCSGGKSTIDRGSQTYRSFVSFSLCGATSCQ